MRLEKIMKNSLSREVGLALKSLEKSKRTLISNRSTDNNCSKEVVSCGKISRYKRLLKIGTQKWTSYFT
jgi:hypothetical protein